MTVLVTLFVQAIVVTGPSIIGIAVFFPAYIREFHWNHGQVSQLIFTSVIVGALLGPVSGWLIDWVGARVVMTVGFVILGAAYLGLSRAQSHGAMMLMYAIFGLGVAMCGVLPIIVVAVNWFGRSRGLGSGVAIAGVAIGLSSAPPILTWIIAHWGWRVAQEWLAVPCFLVGVPSTLLFITTRPPIAGTQSASQEIKRLPGLELKQGLATASFWKLLAVQILFSLGFGAVFLHIIEYLIGVGYTPQQAALISSLQTLESGVGVVALGALADRTGARPVLAVSMVVLAGGIAALLGAASKVYSAPMVIAFVLFWGTTATSINTLLPILIAETLGLRRLGSFSGLIHFGSAIAQALGPLLSGILFDMTGSYTRSFEIGITLAFVTGMLVMTVRPARGHDEIPADDKMPATAAQVGARP
jgi:MFS family permease